jgi:protein-disulfide isomerase
VAEREEERARLREQRHATESEEAQAQHRRRVIQYSSLAAFLGVVIVAVLIAVSQSGGGGDEGGGSTPSDLKGVDRVNAELQGTPQSGATLGDANATVTVTEFGDPQCTACKFFAESVAPQLISEQVATGDVKLEYRPWLIIGPDSKPAAAAALAAGEQDRFWTFLQIFYANQGPENSGYVTDAFLESVAKAAGVSDIDRWNQDRDESKWDAEFSKNDTDATTLGFGGTPSILVSGPKGQKPLAGFQLNEITSAVEQVK